MPPHFPTTWPSATRSSASFSARLGNEMPVTNLAQMGGCEQRVEFWLAAQHQLEQLAVIRLKVGQPPDFFDGLRRHCVSLIYQYHDLPTHGVTLDQFLLERLQRMP